MTPLTTARPERAARRLEVTPTPWSSAYPDYWGSRVTTFEVHDPHTELTVVATSIVETSAAETQPERRPWEALEGGAGRVVVSSWRSRTGWRRRPR